MPHCIIEYSKDLDQALPISELVSAVHQSVFSSGLFEESSIKTRAIEYKYYQSGLLPLPFIHITLKIMFGRNHQQKKELTSLVLDTLKETTTPPISLSVEVIDIEKVSYKRCVNQSTL